MDLTRNHFQRTTSWNTPYTFSGKEKDAETGYGYVKKLRFFSSLAFGNEKQVFHYAHCLRRFGARYYDSGLSIWLTVDPMSDKYPSMSPYNYCTNNPVILVDPDGREIIIKGYASEAATQQLENQTSKKFNHTKNSDGTISYSGKASSRTDRFLKKAIDNKNITVNIEAKNENSFTWNDGSTLPTENGSGYGGNSVDGEKVNTSQKVCPSMLADFDRSVGDDVIGTTMLHEVAESYFGGKIAKKEGSSPRQGISGSTYDRAHAKANRIALGNKRSVYIMNDELEFQKSKIGTQRAPIVKQKKKIDRYERTY